MAQPALNAVISQAAVAGNLDLSIAATFGDGDVNGDLFIGNGSGEQEEESMDLICWIPNFEINPAEQTAFRMLDNQTTAYLRKIFLDLVCIVAWYFRATGHHSNAEADERIGRVCKGCIHADQRNDCGIPWIHICRTSFKCIFPIDKELFWNEQAAAMYCSRPLILRLSTYPAGSAAYGAVLKGYMDFSTVFPMFDQKFANIGAILAQVSDAMTDDNPMRKMGLSINARFYGQPRIALDESVLSSCAATILACLNAFTEYNPLGKSKALQRAGNGAPITYYWISN